MRVKDGLRFIVDHPTFGRRTYACISANLELARAMIGSPMQGGICIGVQLYGKDIPDNHCARHLDRWDKPKATRKDENLCDVIKRTTSVPVFQGAPQRSSHERVRRGWAPAAVVNGKRRAAVMHGETMPVEPLEIRQRKYILAYVPPKGPELPEGKRKYHHTPVWWLGADLYTGDNLEAAFMARAREKLRTYHPAEVRGDGLYTSEALEAEINRRYVNRVKSRQYEPVADWFEPDMYTTEAMETQLMSRGINPLARWIDSMSIRMRKG